MKFFIQGGKKLEGGIQIAGAKNAATKMMVASLLTGEECVFKNFPDIGDTRITAELCRMIGSEVSISGNILKIRTLEIKNNRVVSLSRKNRIPILTLGPLLHRSGKAEIPVLGGDKIGPRPVDFHLKVLKAMGAEIEIRADRFVAEARDGLHGADVEFSYPSVGATETALLTAVLARGRTAIKNAAREPEVAELIAVLRKMGAKIETAAERLIVVDGVEKLNGVEHSLLYDRNEAVSFACLAAASNGRIFAKGANAGHLKKFLEVFAGAGGGYEIKNGGIVFYRSGPLRGVEIETDTYPGFMTDWQQPFAVLLTQAEGVSAIHETVYEDRFGYADDLNLMGAKIKIASKCLGKLKCRFENKNHFHSAEIKGPTPLRGANLTVRDLRAGIAHLIAALIAEGESVIDGVEEIDRGYEKIDERLKNLGAEIKRVESS